PSPRRARAVPGRPVAPAASNTKVTSSTGTAPPAHSSVTVSAGTIWRSGCATHRWRPELCVVVGRNRDLLFRAGRVDTGNPCCRCALTHREHGQRHTAGPQQKQEQQRAEPERSAERRVGNEGRSRGWTTPRT